MTDATSVSSLSSLSSGDEDALAAARSVSGAAAPGDAEGRIARASGLSPTLARRTRKDVLRAKRETGPGAEGARRRAAERASRERSAAARAEKEKEEKKEKKEKEEKRRASALDETPRWTESGARIVPSSVRALAGDGTRAANVDRRCKACFYADASRKRCGSAKAPTFCFLR